MCDPLTIAGIALTGASSVANSVGQSKMQRARDDALAAERIRQGSLDREADALNLQSQDRYQDFGAQQDQKSGQLAQFFQEQSAPADTANASAVIPTSNSNVTVAEEAKQKAQATAFTNGQAARLGELRAFGDTLGGIGRAQARDASQIGQIGGFKRGSSAVLPYELEGAKSAGGGARALGDVLGAAGSLATSAGLNGAMGDTIANSLEIKLGADPWRGLRNVATPTTATGTVRLSPTHARSR